MNRHRYTRELLAPLVKESFSVAEVCRKLGLVGGSGTGTYVKLKIRKFNLSTSHFKHPFLGETALTNASLKRA
jgi:hypothetical protein